ncbi:MAG: EAL domain-containing protein [Sulfurimonas sp.]|nr:EAL domain-containing protein [Sulfurimonas sp.]MDD5203035.1 EAL domain-containing protein [Sulfurimonas sp.]
MKNFSHIYTDSIGLDLFLKTNDICDNPKLLIQLFTAFHTKKEILFLLKKLAQKFVHASLIGASHDGAIQEGKLIKENETLLSFTQFDDTKLQTCIIATTSDDSFEMGQEVAKSLQGKDLKAIITFTDGIFTNGEEYLSGVNSINKNITIAGGMAGDGGLLKETFIFTKNEVYNHGAVALGLYNTNLQVSSDYSFNWMPIGKKLLVTKAKANRLYELEGQSATSIYEKYMGKELALRLPQIGIEFPLIIERDGVMIGRAVIDKKEDGSLIFAGNINEGEYVSFGIGNIEKVLRESNYSVLLFSKKTSETIFIYSCMARRRFMGSYIEKELEPLENIAPTSGFFTYGEFYYKDGKAQLLNETMTVLALSENKQSPNLPMIRKPVDDFEYKINPLHVLSHLANSVSEELEQLNKTLEERVKNDTEYILAQVYKDTLTSLPNRLRLLQDLRHLTYNYLILININDFTSINDFYGHKVGDMVLKTLGKRLLLCAKKSVSAVYRVGSDEFAIISSNEDIYETLKNIYDNFNESVIEYDKNLVYVTITAAAAKIDEKALVLANADMTLKRARQENKPYLLFQEDMDLYEKNRQSLSIAKEIRTALEQDRIILFYQPIINLKTQKIEKYESLVRLVKKDGSILLPVKFLDISHKIRLYSQITQKIIEHSFKKFQYNDFKFSVNLSISDILDENIQTYLFEKVEKYGIGKRLTLEILETQSLENDVVVKRFIKKAQSYGIKIAIDDFGSGFANFQHITRIHADIMKIDGSLIRAIDTDENARVVVETLVIFAKKLKMTTVAEFVHSQEVYTIIKDLGIDYAQGSYLGEPSPTLS